MSRMTNTGQGAERTTWPRSDRGTRAAWRRTRSPSAPPSWRRRTRLCARRWPTYGKSWASARTSLQSTKLDTGPCKLKGGNGGGSFFFLLSLRVGVWLDGRCVSCLIAPHPNQPFCLQHFTRSRNKTDLNVTSFVRVCVYLRTCVHTSVPVCVCVRMCVRASASQHFPFVWSPLQRVPHFYPDCWEPP